MRILILLSITILPAIQLLAAPKLALLVDETGLPGVDAVSSENVADAVSAAGYRVQRLSVDDLAKQPPESDLLIIPSARALPVSTTTSIEKYLRNKGNLIACGLPAWDLLVSKYDGQWMSRDDYDRAIHSTQPQHIGIDFAKEDLTNWKRESDSHEPLLREITGGVLHVRTPELTGWDNLARWVGEFFPKDHVLTCFRARGGDNTKRLAIEWRQHDGARFIATVPLSTQWHDYVLTPEDFKPWEPAKGHRDDVLDPKQVAVFTVGVSHSHTTLGQDSQEFWITDIGTASLPIKDRPREVNLPKLEMLSPFYQTFDTSDVAKIATPGDQRIVRDISLSTTCDRLLEPRPQASGIDKKRLWRWQPLLEAYSKTGDFRGTVAAMLIDPKDYNGIWVSFAPSDPKFYQQPAVQQIISDAARAISRGVFLREGGSQFYTVFDHQPIRVGARLIGVNDDPPLDTRVRITVKSHDEKSLLFQQDWPVNALTHSGVNMYDTFTPDHISREGCVVTTELFAGNHVVDRISHELHQYDEPAQHDFIQARDGQFWLGGRPWKVNGINYMPSSGIGQNEQDLFEYWLSSAAYDPIVVQRDLQRIADLGFNAVSIFIYRNTMEANNLLDFLQRCRNLKLHVNLSLRPGDPFHYDFEKWKQIIQHYRLAESDVVFAYDIAWEATHWGRDYQQKFYTKDWRAWVLNKYGSAEEAAAVWHVDVPRTIEVPQTQQLIEDGPWRNLALDYRQFLDELLERKYGDTRRKIREIDPNHSVSFRMNTAGDPTSNMPEMLSYDLWGLRNAVDFFGPEGYGRIGDWSRVREGLFTVAYAQLCGPNKPVVWAETGYPIRERGMTKITQEKLQTQATFYRDFYRMLRESGSDGVFFWWYEGGYRADERSDFGIINEDGTDRPVTKVIREEGRRFLEAAKPKADAVMEISRNEDARGLVGSYEKAKEKYWKLTDAQHHVELKWKELPRGAQ